MAEPVRTIAEMRAMLAGDRWKYVCDGFTVKDAQLLLGEIDRLQRVLNWVLDQASWRDHYYWSWDTAPLGIRQGECCTDRPVLEGSDG